METVEKILEKLEEEMCDILCKKQPLTPPDVDVLAKLSDTYKDVATGSGMGEYIEMLDDGGQSYGMRIPKASFRRGRNPSNGQFMSMTQPMPRLSYNRDYSMGDGMSNNMNSRKYDGGYSGHSVNDRMIDSLERMMDQAENEYEREKIRKEIEHLRMQR